MNCQEEQKLTNAMMDGIVHLVGKYAEATGKDIESVFYTTGKFMQDRYELLARRYKHEQIGAK